MTTMHILHVTWHKILLVLGLHLLIHNSGTAKSTISFSVIKNGFFTNPGLVKNCGK